MEGEKQGRGKTKPHGLRLRQFNKVKGLKKKKKSDAKPVMSCQQPLLQGEGDTILLLSMTSYNMEPLFGHYGFSVPATSPPNFLPIPNLLVWG